MTKVCRIEPRAGEEEDDFISRCMGSEVMQSEFPDQDQRLAVCFDKFRDRNKQDLTTQDLEEGGGLRQPQQGKVCPAGQRFDPDSGKCVAEETFATRQTDSHGCTPDQRYDGTLGRCVKKGLVDQWSPENELHRLKIDVQKRQHLKNKRKQDPAVGIGSLGNRQVDDRQDPDPFLELELAMALALAERAFAVADQDVLPLFDDQVLPEDPTRFNQARLDNANEQAGITWERTMWTSALAGSTALLLERAFRAGEAQVSAGIVRGAPTVQRVLENMLAITNFRSNEFFNAQVIPAIQRKINELFVTGAFDQVDLAPIRRTLDRRLKSVPYWRVVANAAASRTYHYGLLKAAQAQGFTGYQFVAVLDEKTSDICREINGRRWFIADAVRRFEQVAGSDDPDEVKRTFPWVRVDDVRDLGSDALREMGVMVPPLHGNCRSTLRPIF